MLTLYILSKLFQAIDFIGLIITYTHNRVPTYIFL